MVYVHTAPGNETRLMLGQQELSSDEDVFPFKAQWINPDTFLYTADGRIRVRQLSSEQPATFPLLPS